MRTLKEETGKIFFCGKDAATALGYRDTVNAIKAHCKGNGITQSNAVSPSLLLLL